MPKVSVEVNSLHTDSLQESVDDPFINVKESICKETDDNP